MKRWLFNLAAGVSLVLWVATVTLWIRSYAATDRIGFYDITTEFDRNTPDLFTSLAQKFYGVESAQGGVGIQFTSVCLIRPPGPMPPEYTTMIASSGGFNARQPSIVMPDTVITRRLKVPGWAVVLFFSVSPFAWVFLTYRKWQRGRQGQCRVCGYDLRATPDRCPECGSIPPKAEPISN